MKKSGRFLVFKPKEIDFFIKKIKIKINLDGL